MNNPGILSQLAELEDRVSQLIERNEVLVEALRECRELFSEIRNDWYDPRSQCREGWRIIDTALSATIRNG